MIACNLMNSQTWHFLASNRASAVTQNDRAMLREILVKTTSQANRANLLFAYAEMLRKNAEYEARNLLTGKFCYGFSEMVGANGD